MTYDETVSSTQPVMNSNITPYSFEILLNT